MYRIVDEVSGDSIPNNDEEMMGRGEYKERDIFSSLNDAVTYLTQVVDEKIEELENIKRDLLNNIEEETRRELPQYINEDLFDLSE